MSSVSSVDASVFQLLSSVCPVILTPSLVAAISAACGQRSSAVAGTGLSEKGRMCSCDVALQAAISGEESTPTQPPAKTPVRWAALSAAGGCGGREGGEEVGVGGAFQGAFVPLFPQ